MEEKKYDEEMLHLMLQWLNRGMDVEGHFQGVDAAVEMELTDEDYAFLREIRIAIP